MSTTRFFTKIDKRSLAISIVNEDHTIGEDTPNKVFLNEVPETAVGVTISGFTRVTGTPAALQFVVTDEGDSAELVFNGADDGTEIQVSYSGLGSEVRGRDINRIQSWMQDVAFDVEDYGALGDGTTDDTQAVLDALADMSNGDILFFPGNKTFVIDKVDLGVSGHTNMTFLGGPGSIIKKKTSGTFGNTNTEHVFYDASSTGLNDGFQCIGLEFDLSRTSASVGDTCSAFFFARINDMRFVNVTVRDGIEEGFKLYKCQNYYVVRCTFDNIRNNGVQNHSPSTGESYTGGRANQPTKDVWILDSTFTDIDDGLAGAGDGEGVTFNSTEPGLVVSGVHVSGCKFSGCIRGIWTEFNTGSGGCEDATFTNNTIDLSLSHGIGVVGVTRFTVSGNIITDPGDPSSVSSDLVGIIISGNSSPPRSTDGLVYGNTCVDTRSGSAEMEYGILLRNCDDVKVYGNNVSGYTQVDVFYDDATTITFADIEPSKKVSVLSTLSANQSLTNVTFDNVAWDVDEYNTWSPAAAGLTAGEYEAHDPDGSDYDNEYFIAPHPGVYELYVQLCIVFNATGARRLRIRKWDAAHSASVIVGQDFKDADPADETTLSAFVRMYLDKGEHFQVQAYQASGGALNLIGNEKRTYAAFSQHIGATE